LAREGSTVVVVTHERELGHFFTRTVTLRDGRVRADTGARRAPVPTEALA
jgi:ABC-type lipoprotein export system ATPase subunit